MSKILVAEDQEVARLQDAERRGRAGPAAFDEAVKHWPDQKLTLRQGIMLIREHPDPPRRRSAETGGFYCT
jgi:hypothetical protein